MGKLLVGVVALVLAIAGGVVPALAGGAFKNKSFNGNYAIVMSGSDVSQSSVCPSPPCAAALTGQLVSNGSGKITGGSVNLNVDSVTCTGQAAKSLYSINSDGTGTVSLSITTSVSCTNSATFPIGAFNLSITLYNGGKQAVLASQFTSPDGLVMSGSAATQNNIP